MSALWLLAGIVIGWGLGELTRRLQSREMWTEAIIPPQVQAQIDAAPIEGPQLTPEERVARSLTQQSQSQIRQALIDEFGLSPQEAELSMSEINDYFDGAEPMALDSKEDEFAPRPDLV